MDFLNRILSSIMVAAVLADLSNISKIQDLPAAMATILIPPIPYLIIQKHYSKALSTISCYKT
jgi:hypothetical protein